MLTIRQLVQLKSKGCSHKSIKVDRVCPTAGIQWIYLGAIERDGRIGAGCYY
jgi:hypothetical protein